MKKKSTSQSAFLNIRVLIGLSVVLFGAFLALAGFGNFSALAQTGGNKPTIITHSNNPLVPVPFDCSRIQELGIDKQLNMRAGAIMVACSEAQGRQSATSPLLSLTQVIKKLLMPFNYGATDVNLITGPETPPNLTQSTTFAVGNPDNPLQILVGYNDMRGRSASPPNGSGAS
jgi:hypothetical protein